MHEKSAKVFLLPIFSCRLNDLIKTPLTVVVLSGVFFLICLIRSRDCFERFLQKVKKELFILQLGA